MKEMKTCYIKKLFIDRKSQLGLMFDYIDVSFRLHGFSDAHMEIEETPGLSAHNIGKSGPLEL